MPPENRRATIKDVARAAGVSPTTVSQAFNGNRAVNKQTLQRVHEVAEEIGYRPNAVARGLRESRLNVISLVLRPLDTLDSVLPAGVDFFLRFAGTAALTAIEHGFNLMMIADPTKPDAPASSLAADVCIVTDPFENDPVLTLLKRQHIPVLAIGIDPARPDFVPSIDSSSDHETYAVLDHLKDSGGTRVGLALGTDRNAWNIDARRAYLEWCAQRGQAPIVFENPETSGESAGEVIAADAFDPSRPAQLRPDAIYCLTGRHASGLVKAAQRRGIEVPDDLLVAAGSDAIQNRTGNPTVTAIDLQPELLARRAVELAVQLVEGMPPVGVIEMPGGVLRIRESTTRRGAAGHARAPERVPGQERT